MSRTMFLTHYTKSTFVRALPKDPWSHMKDESGSAVIAVGAHETPTTVLARRGVCELLTPTKKVEVSVTASRHRIQPIGA